MADYRKLLEQEILKQQGAVDPTQKQLEDQIMQPSGGPSIAPTLGLVDHLTGSNFAGQEPKELSTKDKLAQLLQMRQGQQAQKMQGLGQLAKMQNDSEEKSAERQFKNKMYDMQLAVAKAKASKGAAGSPRKLGSEDVKAVSNMDALLDDLSQLKGGLQAGEPLRVDIFGYPIGGDNNASAAKRRAKEWFGRNQSGGAIGKEEGTEFGNIIAGLADSDEMRVQKVDDLYNKILQRRQNYMQGPSVHYQGPQQSMQGNFRDPSGGSAAGKGQGSDLENMSLAELELLHSSLGGN